MNFTTFVFYGALPKSTGAGDFEIFRKIHRTRDFSFSLYWKTLSFYDEFPVLGIILSLYQKTLILYDDFSVMRIFIFPVLKDFEFLRYFQCTPNFILSLYWKILSLTE